MIYKGLKNVIRRDTDPFRQAVYADLKARRLDIRLAEKLYKLCPVFMKVILLTLYGFKSWLSAPRTSGSENLGIWLYENEKKQFQFLNEILGSEIIALRQISIKNTSINKLLLLPSYAGKFFRFMRLMRRISRRYNFLISCRLSSTLFLYSWFVTEFRISKVKVVVLSSEANPYAMAALGAAKKFGIKTVYIPHGHVAENPPDLDYDFNLLDGPALEETYRTNGKITGEVIYKGISGLEGHMTVRPEIHRVGFFLSLIYEDNNVENIIKSVIAELRPVEIIIRPHPNEILGRTPQFIKNLISLNGVKLSINRSVSRDVSECDLIFCGNSSVHLTALKQGTPTIHFAHFDSLPLDTRHFIREKIVFYATSPDDIELNKIADFYGKDWIQRFRKYDPTYGMDQVQEIRSFREKLRTIFINE